MKKLLSLFVATILLSGVLVINAQAYFVSFDHTGSGNDANLIDYRFFQLNSINNPLTFVNPVTNVSTGDLIPAGTVENGHLFTFQDLGDGSFTEQFNVMVSYGEDSSANNVFFDEIYLNLDLQGQYVDNSNIYFTGGSATMYKGLDNIAELDFNSALISELTGSLLGGPGLDLGMKIDFSFLVTEVNSLYFGANEELLVDNEWLFSIAAGRIDQENIWQDDVANQFIIEWQFPGAQMEFQQVVPEPGTMLLLGIGLLGVGVLGRKRLTI